MSHGTWVVVHVLGAVIFIGSLMVTAVWKTLADNTREPSVIAYAQRLVTVTDVAFTATGATLIAISGFVLASDWGGITGPNWLTLGFSGFALSGAIWLTVLVPTQMRQARLTRGIERSGTLPDDYWRLARRWVRLRLSRHSAAGDHALPDGDQTLTVRLGSQRCGSS